MPQEGRNLLAEAPISEFEEKHNSIVYGFEIESSGKTDSPEAITEYVRTNFGEEVTTMLTVENPSRRKDILQASLKSDQPYIAITDGLRYSGYYNFNTHAIRKNQIPDLGSMLSGDGANLASVIESVNKIDKYTIYRVQKYLSAIVPDVISFNTVHYGGYNTVSFKLAHPLSEMPLEFDAIAMSDGTLRTLAALMAAFQVHYPAGPTLVAIEEPETSLHPGAMRALVDALDEATLRTQILLTTHSAEMLDNPTIQPENVRVVQMIDGRTVITPVDEASVEIVRRKLNTLGGLERDNLPRT